MDRISDGIEWRSEQQELFLWLFQQAGALLKYATRTV